MAHLCAEAQPGKLSYRPITCRSVAHARNAMTANAHSRNPFHDSLVVAIL